MTKYNGGREIYLTQKQAELTLANFHYYNPEYEWLLKNKKNI